MHPFVPLFLPTLAKQIKDFLLFLFVRPLSFTQYSSAFKFRQIFNLFIIDNSFQVQWASDYKSENQKWKKN